MSGMSSMVGRTIWAPARTFRKPTASSAWLRAGAGAAVCEAPHLGVLVGAAVRSEAQPVGDGRVADRIHYGRDHGHHPTRLSLPVRLAYRSARPKAHMPRGMNTMPMTMSGQMSS